MLSTAQSGLARITSQPLQSSPVAPIAPAEVEANPWSATPGTEHHAYCNACVKTIVGIRYVCVGCEDFDYCQSCVVNKRSEHDSSHQFWPVTHAGPLPVHVRDARRMRLTAPATTAPVTTAAIPTSPFAAPHTPDFASNLVSSNPLVLCDGCDASLTGQDRYKCLDCPHESFDLCSNCHSSGTIDHPSEHQFHKIPANVSRVVVHRVYDDGREEVDNEHRNTPSSVTPGSPAHDAICDICNDVVIGVRWKCLDCNYDTCQRCFAAGRAVSHHHQLIRIAEPGNVVVHRVHEPTRPSPFLADAVSQVATSSVVHNATCNMCDSRIESVRYKCTRCPGTF